MSSLDEYLAERWRAKNAAAQKVWAGLSDREREFFQKLEALCVEYGVTIEGCGCCESPYIGEVGTVRVTKEAGLTFDGGKPNPSE